jgi:kynureninase
LNAGPGAIGGCFVHHRHSAQLAEHPRLAGWWGHEVKTRFDMLQPFQPIPGAFGFRLSNPCVLSTTALRASLEIFCEVGMNRLQRKSRLLTAYLELLLKLELEGQVVVLSPSDETQRGCHLYVVAVSCVRF